MTWTILLDMACTVFKLFPMKNTLSPTSWASGIGHDIFIHTTPSPPYLQLRQQPAHKLVLCPSRDLLRITARQHLDVPGGSGSLVQAA